MLKDYHFNPHSHEGSDDDKVDSTNVKVISIHTPTKGVTTNIIVFPYVQLISIHTPTKGVTVFKKAGVLQ